MDPKEIVGGCTVLTCDAEFTCDRDARSAKPFEYLMRYRPSHSCPMTTPLTCGRAEGGRHLAPRSEKGTRVRGARCVYTQLVGPGRYQYGEGTASSVTSRLREGRFQTRRGCEPVSAVLQSPVAFQQGHAFAAPPMPTVERGRTRYEMTVQSRDLYGPFAPGAALPVENFARCGAPTRAPPEFC